MRFLMAAVMALGVVQAFAQEDETAGTPVVVEAPAEKPAEQTN